jgi:hypothetical protein
MLLRTLDVGITSILQDHSGVDECLVCLCDARAYRCRPCGHAVMCKACAEEFSTKNMPCPICRETVLDCELS